MVHGVVHGVVYGFGVCINDVVYYLDFGGGGLVRLNLSIGVWFWMRYGEVIKYKSCPPKRNATSILCVRFLTNYDVGGKIMT